jgi:predicted Ser/Thr protein kinase
LYEAGKEHREAGNWGVAKEFFRAAKKTRQALPSELQDKNERYLEECDDKCDNVDEIEVDESATVKIGGNEAFELYKQAKRLMARGDANQARQLFEAVKQHEDVPKELKKRTCAYIKALRKYKGEEATTCVFSDNFTHLLGSSAVTFGLSTTAIGLSTKTMATSRRSSRELVMVLDEKFPADSKARGDLIILLKTDVRKALAAIQIDNITRGSVIVHFRFANDSNQNIAWLEEEYLKQVDDKKSKLYEGTVTRRIDQQRTQTLTIQLGSRLVHAPCPYHVGDTITLAQVDNETIECTVDSLLGEGATATVFKVTTNGKPRALKVFKAENSLTDLCEEASLMLTSNHRQSHPNMLRVAYVWYEQRTHEMFFLMDLVDGTDLQTWMDDERLYAGTVQEQEQRLALIAHQLGCALQHLHKLGILHEDVKPDNVLMTADGSPVLADVGVGNQGIFDGGVVTAVLRGGTPVYASPHVRKLFFEAKSLPVTERMAFLGANKITHVDDFFALGATTPLGAHPPPRGGGGGAGVVRGGQWRPRQRPRRTAR